MADSLCRKRSVALEGVTDTVGVHSYKLLQSQIWALLPCFCNNPTDLKDNFKVSSINLCVSIYKLNIIPPIVIKGL
jgi:hypothetical protein